MSDSELSDAKHSDDLLEQELRKVVRDVVRSGKLEDLTVKRVRLAAEKSLGLEEGFYKSDAWKDRSKVIIESEANTTEPAHSEDVPAKRKSPDVPGPAKRQKTEPAHARDSKAPKKTKAVAGRQKYSSSDLSDAEDRPKKPSDSGEVTKKGRVKVDSTSELSDVEDDSSKPAKRKKKAKPAKDDSSDLSSPIESSPPPTKKKRAKKDTSLSATKSSAKAKPKAGPKPTSKVATAADPESEEIRSLQSWLGKCGIRKVWGKELKPYETPKEKIAHLRSMLADVGMTGRPSNEKAEKIRDMRELQADLEAVQEGAKWWGKSDENEDRGERRRRLSRPFTVRRRIVDDDDDDDDDDEVKAGGDKKEDGNTKEDVSGSDNKSDAKSASISNDGCD